MGIFVESRRCAPFPLKPFRIQKPPRSTVCPHLIYIQLMRAPLCVTSIRLHARFIALDMFSLSFLLSKFRSQRFPFAKGIRTIKIIPMVAGFGRGGAESYVYNK